MLKPRPCAPCHAQHDGRSRHPELACESLIGLAGGFTCPNFKHLIRGQLVSPLPLTALMCAVAKSVCRIFGRSTPSQVLWPAVVERTSWPVQSLTAGGARGIERLQYERVDGTESYLSALAEADSEVSAIQGGLQRSAAPPADVSLAGQTEDVPTVGHHVAVLVVGNGEPSLRRAVSRHGRLIHGRRSVLRQGPGCGVGSTVRPVSMCPTRIPDSLLLSMCTRSGGV